MPQPCADGLARVDGEVDARPARPSRRGRPAAAAPSRLPLAQLADVELAARLQPDHEEEERHQAAVDPVAQVLRHAPAPPTPDRQLGRPDRLVGRRARRSPRPARRPWRRAAPRRCRSRCAGTGAAASGDSAPIRCGQVRSRPGGIPSPQDSRLPLGAATIPGRAGLPSVLAERLSRRPAGR